MNMPPVGAGRGRALEQKIGDHVAEPMAHGPIEWEREKVVKKFKKTNKK